MSCCVKTPDNLNPDDTQTFGNLTSNNFVATDGSGNLVSQTIQGTSNQITVSGTVGSGSAVNLSTPQNIDTGCDFECNTVKATSTDDSTDQTTGSIVTNGGLGVGKNIFCAGNRITINSNNPTLYLQSPSMSLSGEIRFVDGGYPFIIRKIFEGNREVRIINFEENGNSRILFNANNIGPSIIIDGTDNSFDIGSTTPSTSQTTGALRVGGGIGAKGDLFANDATLLGLTASMPIKTDSDKKLVSSYLSLITDVTDILPVWRGGTNSNTNLTNGKLMVSSDGKIVEGTDSSNPEFTGATLSGLTASMPIKTDSDKKLVSSQLDLTSDVSGVLPLSNGGSNANLTASNGGIVWTNASQMQILNGTSTAGQFLLSGSNSTPSWSNTVPNNVVLENNRAYQIQDNTDTPRTILHVNSSNDTRLFSAGGTLNINPDSTNNLHLNYNTPNNLNLYSGTSQMISVQSNGVHIGTNSTTNGLYLQNSLTSYVPASLSIYEERTNATLNYTGAWTFSKTVVLSRIGKIVVATFLEATQTADSSTHLTSGTDIPQRFRPSNPHNFMCRGVDNANDQATPALIVVSNNGTVTVYKDGSGASFTLGATCGYRVTGTCWHVA